MKKYLLMGLLLLGLAPIAKADGGSFFEGNDKLYTLHFSTTIINTTTSTDTILIDLSDTVNWPHKETGEILIKSVSITIDKVAASSGSIRMGVVNMVNASTGSVTWFKDLKSELNVSNTNSTTFNNVHPAFYRLRVNPVSQFVDGLTPYILSSEKTSGSTLYQTDVPLITAAGTLVAPAAGDIVYQLLNKAPTSAWNVDIEISYNSKPR